MSYTYTTNVSMPVYTVNATSSSSSFNYSNIAWNGSSLTDGADLKPATLKVMGNAEFDSDIKIQGKSLKDSLDRIEERLAILRPNEELEEKWENLRGLRKMYMELEAEIIEKEKMWAILKK